MANRRVRWIAGAGILRLGGGGLPVGPGTEFDVEDDVAADLIGSNRAVAIESAEPPVVRPLKVSSKFDEEKE